MPEEFELFQFGGRARASTYLGQGQRRLVGLAHKQPLQDDLVELGIGPPVEKLVQLHQELQVDVVGLWRRPAGVPPVPSSGGSQVDGHGALLCVGRGSLLTSIAAPPVDDASSVLLARPPSRSPGAKAAAAENQGEFGPTRDSYSSGSRFMVHPISDLYTLKKFRDCFSQRKTERSRRSSSRSRERARARQERQRGVPPVLVLARCAAMVKLTMIVRLFDGLPLCESLELDKIANLEMYKQQAKVSVRVSERERRRS